MGSKGFVSLNRKIIFIEGETSSADIEIFEKFYPSNEFDISFIPAGDSSTIKNVAEKVNTLLTSSIGYENFYSIIDGDYSRLTEDPTNGARLFQLPIYHIENILLNNEIIYSVLKDIKGSELSLNSPNEIEEKLKDLVLSSTHLRAYTKAAYDFKIAEIGKSFQDKLFKEKGGKLIEHSIIKPSFQDIEDQAKKELKDSIKNDNWKNKCKGRDLMKAFCHDQELRYKEFRNLIIAKFDKNTPPTQIKQIMDKIIN